MKIAQIAPLYESVPPRYYGGTERVVSFLTEELVRQGHEVTLFASGDSETSAELIPCSPQSLRLDKNCEDQLAHHVIMLDVMMEEAHRFDIIHNHIDYQAFPFLKRLSKASVTTLHGRLNIPDLMPLYQRFRDTPVVSISNSQRLPLPNANWQRTIYHGLPEDLFHYHDEPGRYIAFMGRMSPEKRVDRAIKIAKRVGMEIRIAAKIDPTEKDYFDENIKPLLNDPLVDYVGEIGESEKSDFLGNAFAFLFPIDWPEPFGLVMIEAMACGTPVVAYRNGSVPEVIEHGINGFIADGFEDAIRALDRIPQLSRKKCRESFEARFTVRRMASDYLRLYQELIERKAAYAA